MTAWEIQEVGDGSENQERWPMHLCVGGTGSADDRCQRGRLTQLRIWRRGPLTLQPCRRSARIRLNPHQHTLQVHSHMLGACRCRAIKQHHLSVFMTHKDPNLTLLASFGPPKPAGLGKIRDTPLKHCLGSSKYHQARSVWQQTQMHADVAVWNEMITKIGHFKTHKTSHRPDWYSC